MATESQVLELEQEIATRLDFIRRAAEFAEMIALKRGRCIFREVRSCNIHTRYELENFDGFSFIADTGHNMYGGNDVTIIWNRSSDGPRTALRIYWQTSVQECRVDYWLDTPDWQAHLGNVMTDHETIASTLDAASTEAEEKRRLQQETDRKYAALAARAKELQIYD